MGWVGPKKKKKEGKLWVDLFFYLGQKIRIWT